MTNKEFFFKYEITDQTKFSNLTLLRRDINTCFGINPNDVNSKLGYSALWPGTMTILAGIDLLAKFYAGDDAFENSKPRQRFIDYVTKYIDGQYFEEIYQLRNSLLHSFGLFSEGKKSKEYKFILSQDKSFFIKSNDGTTYCISVSNLRDKFEQSIINFEKDYHNMESNKEFDRLFQKYGSTEIKSGLC